MKGDSKDPAASEDGTPLDVDDSDKEFGKSAGRFRHGLSASAVLNSTSPMEL